MYRFPRTDLAMEAHALAAAEGALPGISAVTEHRDGLTVTTVTVSDEESARKLGKPVGRYYTLTLPEEPRRSSDCFRDASVALAALLRRLLPETPETVPCGARISAG